jgi:ABC-type Fe3+/spermidine/putrescine transport system ATPase subunit
VTAVRIDGATRRFGALLAVDGVSIDIRDGELFTLLGPSGCGKTTLLRMVAGFCDLDAGSIAFDGVRVDDMPPHRRNTGMVFQSYAIFPNLTVAGNVAYGLKPRKVPRNQIAARVGRALDLVRLGELGERLPYQLSGGQLQRVALARSLVIEPAVLLLDEPLSNLDAKLRIEMRREIRELQRTLGITAIYVTHDQEEALAISDRVAVMRAGRIEQIGAPDDIYRRPATPFVAEFLGATNLIAGTVVDIERGRLVVAALGTTFLAPDNGALPGTPVVLSLRPEVLRPLGRSTPPVGWAILEGQVTGVEFLGPLTRVDLTFAPDAPRLRVALLDLPPGAAKPGMRFAVAYDPARATLFPVP